MNLILKLSFALIVTGFLLSCQPKGEVAETGQASEVSNADGSSFSVDTQNSVLLWEAAKVTGKHNGTVNLKGGEIVMNNGELVGGQFTIDMGTIVSLDLEGDSKINLENHLKGTSEGREDDFFNVPKYPTASFEITKATKLMNNEDANYIVSGNLTIKDTTKEISFRALVEEDAGTITVNTPPFLIDRTEWGIQYRSVKFFDDLADKAINDEFGLQINLTAK